MGDVAHCGCPASWVSVLLHIDSSGKDQNSKLEVRFILHAYHFSSIIKLRSWTIISQGPSAVATEILWPINPEVFTIWPFTGKKMPTSNPGEEFSRQKEQTANAWCVWGGKHGWSRVNEGWVGGDAVRQEVGAHPVGPVGNCKGCEDKGRWGRVPSREEFSLHLELSDCLWLFLTRIVTGWGRNFEMEFIACRAIWPLRISSVERRGRTQEWAGEKSSYDAA